MPDLQAKLRPPDDTAPTAIRDALKSVGGFPAQDGLEITFDHDTAIITFHVDMPDVFDDGNGRRVAAAVQARIGPTEPFHITYRYFGALSSGASVDLGPVALSGFGLCYREQYSSDRRLTRARGSRASMNSGLRQRHLRRGRRVNIGGFVERWIPART